MWSMWSNEPPPDEDEDRDEQAEHEQRDAEHEQEMYEQGAIDADERAPWPGEARGEEAMTRAEWVWMPHAGHFICGDRCQFHLATYVGGYIVSTVGDYLPDAPVREIRAKSRGVALEGMGDAREADYLNKLGYEQIGVGRLYETMVFKARRADDTDKCCAWRQADGCDLDSRGYNDPAEATRGHMEFCEKWAKESAS